MPVGRMFFSTVQTIGQEETRNGLTEHNSEALDSLQVAGSYHWVLFFTFFATSLIPMRILQVLGGKELPTFGQF